jgi:CBS domain-containing protein
MLISTTIASQLMTRNLVTLSPSCEIFQAIELLLKKRISGAPVVESNGEFVGVFSERSCMAAIVNALYEGLPDANLMPFVDTKAATITPDTDLLTICQTFLDQGVRRLPVLEGRRLVGQISRRDVMQVALNRDNVPRGRSEPLYLSAVQEDSSQIFSRLS